MQPPEDPANRSAPPLDRPRDHDADTDNPVEDAAPGGVPVRYAPQTGRRLAAFALAVAVALGAGFFIVQHRRSQVVKTLDQETLSLATAPPVVDVMRVQASASSQPLMLPGQTSGWYESTIYARVNGYVGQWLVDIGDKVTKGQVLATIETPELDAQLMAAQAKLKSAEAQVDVEQADAAFAKSTYERWRDSPKGVVSEQEREEKKALYGSGVAKLNLAQAQVRLSQAEVDNLTALEAFKQVTAPFTGVITARRIDIGDLVTAGSSATTTSLYGIAQSDKIRVFIDVPQNASAEIAVGAPATVVANEFPDRGFHGVVARTARAIDTASRTLRVEVDVPNPDQALMPGMYVEVTFDLGHSPLPEVRASALIFHSNGVQVAVVGDDGRVKFHPVTIARDNGNTVEIASGLAVNDRVVLNISNQITDGQQVTIDQGDADTPAGRAGAPSGVAEAAQAR